MERRKNVFLAKIKERYCLNPGSEQKTYHITLDLDQSDLVYAVGDCLGIYPDNDPDLVEEVLDQLQCSPEMDIEDRTGQSHSLRRFLTHYANLHRLPKGVGLSIADFCKKIPPLLPRFYSIASSAQMVGSEAHLTIRLEGVCSSYLCCRAPLNTPEVPVFLQKSKHFCLPPESVDKPIVMIGPGTGIAPFRGFIQERMVQKSSAKNWLFFGERTRQHDFYYQKDWEQLVVEGKLKLDCAFSRDQESKIYVQHRLIEQGETIWHWLKEGAYFYVCGDAAEMAKAVDQALHRIIEEQGKYSPAEAKSWVKELRAQNRYQRDVY